MKNLKMKLTLMTLTGIEILTIFYVSYFTYRVKNPTYIYDHNRRINNYSISATGRVIAFGDEDGFIYFFSKNMISPLWIFQGPSEIRSVSLSASGDYLAALDKNDAIALFSNTPIMKDGVIEPIWTRTFRSSKVLGVYSIGEMPPLVYVLIKSQNGIHLLDTKGDVTWNYRTDSREVDAILSYDGKWIIVWDNLGMVYLFSVHNAKPIWSISTQLQNLSVTIPIKGEYVSIVGDLDEVNSQILLLSLKDGGKVFSKSLPNHIRSISTSFDGNKIYLDKGGGSVLILFSENGRASEKLIDISEDVTQIISSPFSSYLAAGTSNGEVYFFHISRSAPLWRFTITGTPFIQMSHDGESIFIGSASSIYYLTNTQFSEVLPGSRFGWGIVFSFGLSIIVVYLSMSRKFVFSSLLPKKADISGVSKGFILGIATGLIFAHDVIQATSIYGVGTATSYFNSWKKKNIASLFTGFYLGFFASGVASLILGLVTWFNGDERDLVQLTISNILSGLQAGILCGPIGAATGLIAVKFLGKFRSKE